LSSDGSIFGPLHAKLSTDRDTGDFCEKPGVCSNGHRAQRNFSPFSMLRCPVFRNRLAAPNESAGQEETRSATPHFDHLFRQQVPIYRADFHRDLIGFMQNSSNFKPGNKQANAKVTDAMLINQAQLCASEHMSKSLEIPNVGVPKSPGGGNGHSSRSKKTKAQKNDKSVEIYHDHRVVARFRTQTDCAGYLRATPEAVSYHCSKGGGVCNGLVIRPAQEPEDGDMAFGLFSGSEKCRPKERPQLKAETVVILKEWLLSPDHMDNPYPNQLETENLMEKTGLDKAQLKHWFNNARKRILKPLLKNGGVEVAKKPRGGGKKKRDSVSNSTVVEDVPKRLRSIDSYNSSTSMYSSAPTVHADDASFTSRARVQNMSSNVSQDSYQVCDLGPNDSCGSGSMMSSNYSNMGFNNNMYNTFNMQHQQRGGSDFASQSFQSRQHFFQGHGTQGDYNQHQNEGPGRGDESFRSTAIFKQQVATMAMNEATQSFSEMEDAFVRAKQLASQSSAPNSDDDPIVREANARAKQFQCIAQFKLKVSQRASDEASKAYGDYQRIKGKR